MFKVKIVKPSSQGWTALPSGLSSRSSGRFRQLMTQYSHNAMLPMVCPTIMILLNPGRLMV